MLARGLRCFEGEEKASFAEAFLLSLSLFAQTYNGSYASLDSVFDSHPKLKLVADELGARNVQKESAGLMDLLELTEPVRLDLPTTALEELYTVQKMLKVAETVDGGKWYDAGIAQSTAANPDSAACQYIGDILVANAGVRRHLLSALVHVLAANEARTAKNLAANSLTALVPSLDTILKAEEAAAIKRAGGSVQSKWQLPTAAARETMFPKVKLGQVDFDPKSPASADATRKVRFPTSGESTAILSALTKDGKIDTRRLLPWIGTASAHLTFSTVKKDALKAAATAEAEEQVKGLYAGAQPPQAQAAEAG